MYLNKPTTNYTPEYLQKVAELKQIICDCDDVVIGAGAGLSAAAGLHYTGERFKKFFAPYIEKYGLTDMYTAGFYNHATPEEFWGYWCKHIYHNRFAAQTNATYKNLLSLACQKNYFVITTNVDHMFQLSGFNKQKLFYTQGDYGLFQCSVPCHNKTYDNEQIILQMVDSLQSLKVPTSLIPHCPKCGSEMAINIRKDSAFVQDSGWDSAYTRYEHFINGTRGKKVLYLDLGIGYNTPGIIKYPFWQMTHNNKNASYACVNIENADCPKEIENRAICINADISDTLQILIGG